MADRGFKHIETLLAKKKVLLFGHQVYQLIFKVQDQKLLKQNVLRV